MTAVRSFLRRQRSGHIVNISSIAGLAPMTGSGLYAAAKFALEGASEALAQEVAPLDIKVTLVEPGAFRTEFLSSDSIRRSEDRIDDYDQTAGKTSNIWKPSRANKLAIRNAELRRSSLLSTRNGRRCILCLAQTRCAIRGRSSRRSQPNWTSGSNSA